MKIVLDTANLEEIKKYMEIYEIAGVTSNPTILAKEKSDFFPLIQSIRELVGDKELHVQVTGSICEEMIKEAQVIVDKVGRDTFIKVPTNEEGIKTMKQLKRMGFRITATAIYMPSQALMAATVGADYVAPYFNRMCNEGIDASAAVEEMAWLFDHYHKDTEILVASLKNTKQVMEAFLGGAHAVTTTPDLYRQMVESPLIDNAVADFGKDWTDLYGDKRIYEL